MVVDVAKFFKLKKNRNFLEKNYFSIFWLNFSNFQKFIGLTGKKLKMKKI